jgi:hypothetical protein
MPIIDDPALVAWAAKKSLSTDPFKPGTGNMATIRQMNKIITVNRILDFNSGILKQLANVLAMFENMAI